MSRSTKKKVLGCLFALLAVIMIFATSCAPGEEMDYTQHEEPDLGVTFEYPQGWRLVKWDLESPVYAGGICIYTEYTGEELNDPKAVVLILSIVPAVEQGGSLTTVDEYVDYTIVQRSIGTTTVISDTSTTVAGQSAREVSISYDLPLPPKVIDPTLVTCITKWVVCKKNGYFYDLQFSAGEDDYNDFFEEVYEYAKETISFAS